MEAIITGATGFLGFHIAKKLTEKGWNVHAFHRPSSDTSDLKPLGVKLHPCTFNTLEEIEQCIPINCDALFHVAGDTNVWKPNNEQQYNTNVTLTEKLVQAALRKQVNRFIHTSSISAFGFHNDIIDEETPSKAMSSGVNYLRTKFLGEQVVKQYCQSEGLDAVILNPCAIIGSHDRQNWSQLFTLILNDELPGIPKGEGCYCHVEAVAEAHIQAFYSGKTAENYILGGVKASFKEVTDKVAHLLGKESNLKEVPNWVLHTLGWVKYLFSRIINKEPSMTPEKAKMVTHRVIARSDKAKQELGFEDQITLEHMLKDCYDWMKKERLI